MRECGDLKGDGSVVDLVQMTMNMLAAVGVQIQQPFEDPEHELREACDEAVFWDKMLNHVDNSRMKIAKETHVHALSDDDINESDLSTLPQEVIEWLKLNRNTETTTEEKDEASPPDAVAVEKSFHFQQFESNQRTINCSKNKTLLNSEQK